ncbi:MAG: VanW family protein [Anaerolineae bacterium]|nr:VanW family protein [Anaerolineae bacterium]
MTSGPQRYYTPQRRVAYDDSMNPWMIRLPMLVVTGLVLLFFLLVAGIAGYQFTYQDRIYPGVSTIFGLNLAGMTKDEARAALANRFTYPEDATFVFRDGDKTWEYTASELGVTMNIEATVNEAYNVGRNRSGLGNLFDQWDVWRSGYPLAPVITYNQSEAEQILGQVSNDFVNRPVQDATLTIQNRQAVVTTSQVGRVVDVPATLALLQQEIMRLSSRSEINLVVVEQAPEVWDASDAAALVNIALDTRGVTFFISPEEGTTAGPWTAKPEDIENMLRIEKVSNGDGTSHYEVNVTTDAVEGFLEQIAPELRTSPVDARFTFNDETKQLEVFQASQDGRELDTANTLPLFERAVFSNTDRAVPLVFQTVMPAVRDTMTAQELGITEQITAATTYFVGSTANRRTNIEVAAARFHGIVIPPHTVFSFNQYLGDVSEEEGYETGLVIVGDQTITGVGGGVCQVSSTLFQAAFYGGFPIIERYPHGYRVAYYETGEGPGLDATVFSPIVDFKFENDTDYHLLLEVYVRPANASIQFKIYSTSVGRKVTKEGPYVRNVTPPGPTIYRATPGLQRGQAIQVDYAVSGSDVYVYRTIKDAEGNILVEKEEFVSHYIPWPAQFQVAPDDPRVNR